MSFPLTLLIIGLAGAVIGSQINRGIYRLAWEPRDIGPWSRAHRNAPPRHWLDRVPIFGWLGLERESSVHGAWFWIRPMIIELAVALGFVALYLWEIDGGLLPAGSPTGQIQSQFFSHIVLISLMTVATFIDIDEKTIPDTITIPGTLFGLGIAGAFPHSMLPMPSTNWLTAPLPWNDRLDGWTGLAFGVAVFLAWCLALLPKTIWFRSGWIRGFRFLFASMGRHGFTWWMGLMGILGCGGIAYGWRIGGDHWRGLLSSLAGVAMGGAIIWAVRIVAGWALRKEAMGFGDVTLLAMIGSYFGWQPVLIIFFISPFAGVFVAGIQWLLTRTPEIAYGPFLCAATLFTLLQWPPIWQQVGQVFALSWRIPVLLLVMMVPMAIMLFGVRKLQGR